MKVFPFLSADSQTTKSLYNETLNGHVSPPPLLASGVKATLRQKQAQTHMQAQQAMATVSLCTKRSFNEGSVED